MTREQLEAIRAQNDRLAAAVRELYSILADYQRDYGPGIACLPHDINQAIEEAKEAE